MIGISKTCGHALRAMICLARKDCSHGMIKSLADCSGVPAPYLAKIIKRLNAAGLVECKRGQQGGVWLSRAPKSISVMDVCSAIETSDWIDAVPSGPRKWMDFWRVEQTRIRNHLERLSIDDLVESPHHHHRKAARQIRRIST